MVVQVKILAAMVNLATILVGGAGGGVDGSGGGRRW